MTANPGTEPDDALVEAMLAVWYGAFGNICKHRNEGRMRAVLAAITPAIERRGIERAAAARAVALQQAISVLQTWLDAFGTHDPDPIVTPPRVWATDTLMDCIDAIRALATDAQPARDAGRVEAFNPTHRHVKRGTEYEVVCEAELQDATGLAIEGCTLTIYRGADGKLWARQEDEFNDGRFEALARAEGGR